jgi:hypothetical protein
MLVGKHCIQIPRNNELIMSIFKLFNILKKLDSSIKERDGISDTDIL